MDRRYQVFISSTFIDLVEERREIIQALLEMDCLPAGMELFPAANEDQWTLIKGVIDQSDYYLVVLGGRYGSTTEDGISYTEMEYDYAVSKGIPVMGFVHGDPGSIPKSKLDLDPELQAKLSAFQDKVQTRMVKRWTTPAELGSVVTRGMIALTKNNKRDGWVRGNLAMTEEVRTQIAELQAQVAKAEKAAVVADNGTTSGLDTSFAHGQDIVRLLYQATLSDHSNKMFSTSGGYEVSWDYIVRRLGVSMLAEAPERLLRERLNANISSKLKRDVFTDYKRVSATITDDSWGTIIIQLRALGVITTGTKKRTVSDKSIYWALTPAGDKYLVGLRAHKRPTGDDPVVQESGESESDE
ncbi:DUF4062 domain-containing protein [Rathayibacter festucae]|nr:DUF4062 domain-containing protein [Rathayibacter festucae]